MVPAAPMIADPQNRGAAPGFDDPLGILRNCHRRIERELAMLERLRRHLPEHHADADARSAARNLLRYFDTAAHNHHLDEEASLFPALVTAAPEIGRITASLARDHARLAAGWSTLRPLLAAIVAGTSGFLPIKGVAEFRAAYEAHIAREESELLPVAAELLDATTLAAIGREMHARPAALD